MHSPRPRNAILAYQQRGISERTAPHLPKLAQTTRISIAPAIAIG